LRVMGAELDGLFDHRVSIQASGGIGEIFVDPVELVHRGGKVAGIETREGDVASGVGAGDQFQKQALGCERIFLGVQRCATKGFHVHEDGWIGIEDGKRIDYEIFAVVGFGARQVPVVANPGKGLGVADVEAVAEEGRTCQRGTGRR